MKVVTAPLWAIADCRPSSIDKKSVDGDPAVRLCNYTDVYYNRHIDSEMELMEATAPADQIERLRVLPGDVLMTKDSESPDDIGIPSLIRTATPDMVCGYHLSLLRPLAGTLDPRYLYWFLESRLAKDHWSTHAFGVTRFSLTSPTVWGLPVVAWNLGQQIRIADFLDREISEIDAMDAELEILVRQLDERRGVLSASTFAELFKGPTVPLWSILRPEKEQGHPEEQVLSVYRDYGVILKDSRDDNLNRTPDDVSAYQLVRPGDVVINKMKAWQGSLGVSPHRGIVSPDYQVARPVSDVSADYLHAVLRCPIMVPQYRVRSRGVRPAQWRLYWEDFANLRVPVPQAAEQGRIAERLRKESAEIDEMIAAAQRLKALLAERRTTLITEVVTGRKEVA